jgi:ElaB/YqjD/DUF883 family membrane-anchored ribosome-binding protein
MCNREKRRHGKRVRSGNRPIEGALREGFSPEESHAMARNVDDVADDAKAQIAQLRRQVESLMSDRVTPVLADAADRAETTARQGIDYTREQAEALSERVRDQPLIAIAIAAGVGYLVGRIFR